MCTEFLQGVGPALSPEDTVVDKAGRSPFPHGAGVLLGNSGPEIVEGTLPGKVGKKGSPKGWDSERPVESS